MLSAKKIFLKKLINAYECKHFYIITFIVDNFKKTIFK